MLPLLLAVEVEGTVESELAGGGGDAMVTRGSARIECEGMEGRKEREKRMVDGQLISLCQTTFDPVQCWWRIQEKN